METAPLAAPATPHRLRALRDAKILSDDAYARALEIAGEPPPRHAQSAFASRAALILGALLGLASVVFFVAHNWGGMSRWAKFGVLELGLVAFAAASWAAKGELTRQLSLSLCAAMLGPLLAVYGQTYQTGADPYELFLSWALLASPIAALSRFMPLWAGVWFVLNLSAGLWCEQLRPFGGDWWHYHGLVLAAVNAIGLVAYELVSRRTSWLGEKKQWPSRTLAVAALLPPLPIACWYLADDHWFASGEWGLPSIAVVLLLTALLGRGWPRDRFMRSAAAFGACGLVTAGAARLVRDGLGYQGHWAWAPLGLFIVLEVTLAAAWIRRAREVRS